MKNYCRKINYGISQMDIYEGDWRSKLHYNNYDVEPLSEIIYSENEQSYLELPIRKTEKNSVYILSRTASHIALLRTEKSRVLFRTLFED